MRSFLSDWQSSPLVGRESSYAAVERALRELGTFYREAGPRARLTPEVAKAVLAALSEAESTL